MKNPIVGIDLGTTMSVLSYIDPNGLAKPEIIKTEEGLHLTRSTVCIENGKVKVGARNSSEDIAKEFKKKMGIEDFTYTLNEKEYTPIELSSFVLKKLKDNAMKDKGLEVEDVVITVPAYFDENRRIATKQAGKLAGLNVVSVINEPTAAALFYSTTIDEKLNGKVLVYDLGGGTFDITIMEINGSNVDILSSEGDGELGGTDFDKLIYELIEEKYTQSKPNGVPYEDDDDIELEKRALLNECEDIKKVLSLDETHTVKIYGSKGKVTMDIKRSDFENKMLNNSYISSLEDIVIDALKAAELKETDIDHILLVGGSTRIPLIRKSIKELIGKEPITTLDVDESVAKGAALKALKLRSDSGAKISEENTRVANALSFSEIATVSFGVIAQDRITQKLYNVIIIPKGRKIPCEITKSFSTVSKNQTVLLTQITTGESENIDEITIVDEFKLDLPPGRPSGQPIETTYAYTGDQSLKCIVKDINSGNRKEYMAKDIYRNK